MRIRRFRLPFVAATLLVAGLFAALSARPAAACSDSTDTSATTRSAIVSITNPDGTRTDNSDQAFVYSAWANLLIPTQITKGTGYTINRTVTDNIGTRTEQVIFYPDPKGFDGVVFLTTLNDTNPKALTTPVGRWYTASLELDKAMNRLISGNTLTGIFDVAPQMAVTVAPAPSATPAPIKPATITTEGEVVSLPVLMWLIVFGGGGLVFYLLLRSFFTTYIVRRSIPQDDKPQE